MQSRVEVVPLGEGDAVAFAVHHRPVRGARGDYRITMRHGVSRLRTGRRHTLGIVFHDAAQRSAAIEANSSDLGRPLRACTNEFQKCFRSKDLASSRRCAIASDARPPPACRNGLEWGRGLFDRSPERMPLYTYTCSDHGEFSAWGQMSTSDAPQPCPSCHEPAPRALAHPSVGGRSGDGDAGYGMGACGQGACEMPSMGGGGCCGGGACVH